MSTKLIYNQSQPLAVIDVQKASQVTTVSAEVVSFLLETGAASAGEVAGTIVIGQISRAPITSLTGDRIGEFSGEVMDSSISFTNGVMIAAQEKLFRLGGAIDKRVAVTAEQLTVNGDWAVDYETGLLIVRKATTADSITLSYKIRTTSAASAAPAGGATEAKQDTLVASVGAYTPSINASATNIKVALKASAGVLGGINAINGDGTTFNLATSYIQLFNLASASVTVGTTAPIYVVTVPPDGLIALQLPAGINFSTAITYAVTTTPAGSTAPTTALHLSFLIK